MPNPFLKRLVARELTLGFVPDTEQRRWRTMARRRYQLTRDQKTRCEAPRDPRKLCKFSLEKWFAQKENYSGDTLVRVGPKGFPFLRVLSTLVCSESKASSPPSWCGGVSI